MNSLFGLELPTPVNLVIAFVVVLLLIGAAAWLVRRLGAAQLNAAARGRLPRLAVVDSAAVDSRRKLVIVRRDNIEHLLMIGGPTDVVVETNIVRAAAAAREPVAAWNGGAEVAPRAASQMQPQPETAVAMRAPPAPRAVAEEAPHWPVPVEADAAPVVRVTGPGEPRMAVAPEPIAQATRVSRPDASPAAPQPAVSGRPVVPVSEKGIADMAQRLESALRRQPAQRTQTETVVSRPSGSTEEKSAARIEPRAVAAQPRGGAQPTSQAPADLEQEMAHLLGRSGKT